MSNVMLKREYSPSKSQSKTILVLSLLLEFVHVVQLEKVELALWN